MPQHHPEDRVRVKNIVKPNGDDIQTVYLTRYKKVKSFDANGQEKTVEVPYEREIPWNFKDGFFFLWGGRAYILKPDEEKSYPRFLANHCAKQQIQYILNDLYEKSKRQLESGLFMYDRNILNNQVLKRKYFSQIILGVEEWHEEGDDDFDAIINKKFGGDLEDYLNDENPTDKQDFELKSEDQDDEMPLEVLKPIKERKDKSDEGLEKLRDEADVLGVEWNEGESEEQIKTRIQKVMA